jgi:hypothetical protein
VCFLVKSQNQGRQFISGLMSKPVATAFWLSLKIKVVEGFSVCATKSTGTFW